MPPERLSALDASFLTVEGPSAHMHVGWAATFEPPEHGPRPELRRPVRPHRRAARAAPRASASGSPPTRSGSTRRCGSTPRTSTPPSTSTAPRRRTCRSSPTRCCRSRCAATARCGSSGSPTGCATAASGSSARPTTAWSTASRRSSSARCCSTPRPTPEPPAEDAHRLAARPRPPRARAARARRLGPHARAARPAAPPARARPRAARDPRLRAAHGPRARRRGAAGRAGEPRSTSPARRTATSPRRGGR